MFMPLISLPVDPVAIRLSYKLVETPAILAVVTNLITLSVITQAISVYIAVNIAIPSDFNFLKHKGIKTLKTK
jgi:hypothetical protein